MSRIGGFPTKMAKIKPVDTEPITLVRGLIRGGHDPANVGRCNWCGWAVFNFSAPPPRMPTPHDNPACPYVASVQFLERHDNPPA